MRKIILMAVAAFALTATQAQEKRGWCLSAEIYDQMIKTDPAFAKSQQDLETFTQQFSEQYIRDYSNPGNKVGTVVRIIPVVVHVIHEGGTENISKAQILSQIDVLNKDYRRLNADTVNTPGPFKSIGADSQIEFRMAQLDPNGNCTDGIVRVFSHLTNNARDNVKALSYWPHDKYLNIWIVKSIENSGGSPGIVAGFAQFPGGTAPAATDGIEVRSDYFGVTGTASPSDAGRVSTHEIGHWLNLRHIWGDDNQTTGPCNGTDYVSDTPNQADMTFSTCPPFPLHDVCTPTGNGVLFSDYMDYTRGNCQNIFTIGQAARMNSTLGSGTSGRNNLWTATNLAATGTDGTPPIACAPIAQFNPDMRRICEGMTLNFSDWSYNGAVTSRVWTFPGGVPATDTSANPVVTYPVSGIYDVSLSVTNAAGTTNQTNTGVAWVGPLVGYNLIPWSEGFETISFPGGGWDVENDGGNGWGISNTAAYTGSNSLRLYNFIGNPTGFDAFITPSYDFKYLLTPKMYFRIAFAIRNSASTDNLRIYGSYDCGKSWQQKYTKTGAALATAGLITSNFVPTASQWRLDSVLVIGYQGKQNVRFKFEYTQASGGNNMYIDDININTLNTGIADVDQPVEMELYPNPSNGVTTLAFSLHANAYVNVRVLDVTGREILQRLNNSMMPAGIHYLSIGDQLNSGIYFVELMVNGNREVQKLIVQ